MAFPISITSKYEGKYSDSIDLDNQIINYNYRDLDPNHRDNLGLQELLRLNIPLIYFLGIDDKIKGLVTFKLSHPKKAREYCDGRDKPP